MTNTICKTQLFFIALSLSALGTVATPAFAAPVTVPNNFSSGTPAVAAEVNDNFNAVKTSVDDNDSRIAALEATINALQNRLTAVEDNSVLELDGNLVYTVDANGYGTAQFTGVNVQVINGVNQTTTNGLGNLIVGYNNLRESGSAVCSNGAFIDQASCEGSLRIWAQSHKTGSHNLVAGDRNSYSRYGGVVFGTSNAINQVYSVVTGGSLNISSGLYSSVSGGNSNIARGTQSSVNGGINNTAIGTRSSVSGGESNTASGSRSSVSGGLNRSATSTNNWAAGSLFEAN